MTPTRPVFLILPGATSNRERREALRETATRLRPEARVEVPDYLSHWRGVQGIGRWLDRWAGENLAPAEDVYVFAFILGAAALPYAPRLLSRIRRLVVLRSRYQEALPRFLRRRFTPLGAAIIRGRAVADLGRPPFWPPGFEPSCPTLTLVETRPTTMAQRFHLKPLSDRELGIEDATKVAVDHDAAYYSQSLMQTAVAWLRDGGAANAQE